MPVNIKSTLRLFDDDAYLYKVIHSIADSQLPQVDLNNLQEWETTWDVEFHPKKCKLLTITNKKKPGKHYITLCDDC